MRSREEQREERLRYEADVAYEVWREGGNPDAVDLERVDDAYYAGTEYEAAAYVELERQRRRHHGPDDEWTEEASQAVAHPPASNDPEPENKA